MSRINTPTNQKLLTNVAVVRMKKAGKRFEIACYKNKVLSWRQGVEKDIDEVLQAQTVFINVSKGQVAKKDDLLKAFETADQLEICKLLLDKGDLQVSDKERQAQQEAVFKDMAAIIAEKCLNPDNQRPYPTSLIEKAMKECHIAVKPNRGAKQQALEVIGKLKTHLPIERAQMKLKLSFPVTALTAGTSISSFRRQLSKLADQVEKEKAKAEQIEGEEEGVVALTCVCDPGKYREIDEMLNSSTQGRGKLELISLQEVKDQGNAATDWSASDT